MLPFPAINANLGRFIEVNYKFPLPTEPLIPLLRTFLNTRVRQPIVAYSSSGLSSEAPSQSGILYGALTFAKLGNNLF